MNNLLPVATASATQTVYFTSTGIEKILTLVGMGTIAVLALLGLFVIVKSMIKGNMKIKKVNPV